MRKPVPPSLEEFGLTEEILASLPKVHLPELQPKLIFWLTAAFGVLIVDWLIEGPWSEKWPLLIILGLFFFLPLSLLIAGAWNFLRFLETKIYEALNPEFRRFVAYKKASKRFEAEQKNYDRWRLRQRETHWRSLDGVSFEREVGHLFQNMGYQVSQTPRTNDGGVDLVLEKDARRTVVQCKAHNKKIAISTVRELSAAMRDYRADKAILACLEGLTKPAAKYARERHIQVLDLRALLDLHRQHG